MLLGQLGFTVVCCIVVRFTVARTMPEDGTYHIGPRQLGSAGLLGVMFVFQFFALQTSLRIGLRPSAVVAPSLLTQFYCVTLLYLQTELFKKAAQSAAQGQQVCLALLFLHGKRLPLSFCHAAQLLKHSFKKLSVGKHTVLRAAAPQAERPVRIGAAPCHAGG